MTRRLVAITEAGDASPGGQLRVHLYRDLFAERGFDVTYLSRRSPSLARAVSSPGPVASRLVAAGAGRIVERTDSQLTPMRERRMLRAAARADIVYIQKVGSYDFMRRLRESTSARIVYDFGDAVWLPSRAAFAGGRFPDILRLVDAVTTDNPYTLAYVRDINPNAYIVPDPPQVEAFDAQRATSTRGSRLVVGWIGSPGTSFNLFAIWEALEEFFAAHPEATLRLVGVGRGVPRHPPFERINVEMVPSYDQARMVKEVLGMDIGLFPMFDIQDSLARGVLKATVYMAGEACVVASPVGQVPDVLEHERNALLARGTNEWLAALDRLACDSELRRRLAAAGLERARKEFSTKACFDRLEAVLEGTLRPVRHPEVTA